MSDFNWQRRQLHLNCDANSAQLAVYSEMYLATLISLPALIVRVVPLHENFKQLYEYANIGADQPAKRSLNCVSEVRCRIVKYLAC